MLEPKYNNQKSEIASYSYTDIAEGTGVVAYNLCETKTSSTSPKILTSNSLYSTSIEMSGATTSSSWVQMIDHDFDLSHFNFPRVIEGTGQVQLGYVIAGMEVDTSTSAYVLARLRKWDGTTETEIVNLSGQTVTGLGGPGNYYGSGAMCIPLTIPTTPFKKGEVLRLTVEAWGKNTVAGKTGTLWIGIDPKGRDGLYNLSTNGTTTNSKIYVPYRIDE